MTKSEHIRELITEGWTRERIAESWGYSASLISHAITNIPKRRAGRPRKLARCEHCGQPMTVKRASVASTSG